jgi:hypothetical protein
MKLRHAAALALVGWYLMTPPIGDDLRPEIGAPLYEWSGQWDDEADQELPPFLTLAECEAKKAANKQSYLEASKNPEVRKTWLRFGQSAAYAQCVKSDDPRLQNPELQKQLPPN